MTRFLIIALAAWAAFGIFAARNISQSIEDASNKRHARLAEVVRG